MPGNVNYQNSSYITPIKSDMLVEGLDTAASGASNYIGEIDVGDKAENAANLTILLWANVSNDANATLGLYAEVEGSWVQFATFDANQANSGLVEGSHSLGVVKPVPPAKIRITLESLATSETVDVYWQYSR